MGANIPKSKPGGQEPSEVGVDSVRERTTSEAEYAVVCVRIPVQEQTVCPHKKSMSIHCSCKKDAAETHALRAVVLRGLAQPVTWPLLIMPDRFSAVRSDSFNGPKLSTPIIILFVAFKRTSPRYAATLGLQAVARTIVSAPVL